MPLNCDMLPGAALTQRDTVPGGSDAVRQDEGMGGGWEIDAMAWWSHVSAAIGSTKPCIPGSSETTCCKTCFQGTDIVMVLIVCALTDFLPPQAGF